MSLARSAKVPSGARRRRPNSWSCRCRRGRISRRRSCPAGEHAARVAAVLSTFVPTATGIDALAAMTIDLACVPRRAVSWASSKTRPGRGGQALTRAWPARAAQRPADRARCLIVPSSARVRHRCADRSRRDRRAASAPAQCQPAAVAGAAPHRLAPALAAPDRSGRGWRPRD